MRYWGNIPTSPVKRWLELVEKLAAAGNSSLFLKNPVRPHKQIKMLIKNPRSILASIANQNTRGDALGSVEPDAGLS
jgi:hypothetical protein